MYKKADKSQPSFLDFDQPLGLQMNPNNRWIDMANRVPWAIFEEKYAELFPSLTGNVAKPLRMALGSLIVQKKFQYSDKELVEQITENPYLQFFIGLPGYQEEAPFDASTLVLFRKRILVDQIYRIRENRQYCKDCNIRMSGPKLGRPSKEDQTKESKKETYKDNVDRIAVEREFSVAKRSYGLGLITTKLEETQLSSIALSIFVSNLFKIQRRILFALLWLLKVFGIFEQLSEQNEVITC